MATKKILYLLMVILINRSIAYADDLATNKQMIQGSWYCPPTQDIYHRYDFNSDGTMMWYGYSHSNNMGYHWSPSYTKPKRYKFQTPTRVDVGNDVKIIIMSLSRDKLIFKERFYDLEITYSCNRIRPPGDTDASRMKSAEIEVNQKKRFYGKWISTNGKEYVEFLPGNKCILGIRNGKVWQTTNYEFDIFYEGETANCENAGVFHRKSTNEIVLDHGMGGTPEIYHRINSGKQSARLPRQLDRTETGFYYPLGKMEYDTKCGKWLGRDRKNGGCYFDDKYHIGVDMMASYLSSVYPISNGEIYDINRSNDWENGNVAVIVKHKLSDSTYFYAIYGHVKTLLNKGDPVTAGIPFAQVGKYSSGDHLHFGIWEPNRKPSAPYGRMPNYKWPDTNGFVNPIDFIKTYSPD